MATDRIDAFSRFVDHLRGLGGLRAAILGVLSLGLITVGERLFEVYEDRLEAALGMDKAHTMLVLLGALLVAIALFVANEWGKMRVRHAIPALDLKGAAEMQAISYRTKALDDAIHDRIIPEMFKSSNNPLGFESMPVEEIAAVGKINRYTAVGVYSGRRRSHVGYASIWPVADEIGEKLLNGAMTDSDLTRDHVVPEDELQRANYIIFPGIAVLDIGTADRTRALLKLLGAIRQSLLKNYMLPNPRVITLIAIGYETPGIRLCTDHGFNQRDTFADYGDGKPVPIFYRTVTIDDLLSG